MPFTDEVERIKTLLPSELNFISCGLFNTAAISVIIFASSETPEEVNGTLELEWGED